MIPNLIHALIYIIIACIIGGLATWLVDVVPIPPPFNRIAKVCIIVVVALIIILALLGLVEPQMKLF